NPSLATAHLQLVMSAVIQQDASQLVSDMMSAPGGTDLGTTIQSVKDLDPGPFGGNGPGISLAGWTKFFADPSFSNDMPAFAKKGASPSPQIALGQEVAAFVRRFTQFFGLTAIPTPAQAPPTSALPLLDEPLPSRDVMGAFVVQYTAQGHPGFVFGATLTLVLADAQAAAALVFPSDSRAAAWLVEAASAINALYYVADVTGNDPLRFSIAEALYARGFYSGASITALMADDFQDALIGTVAYIYATQIQAR